MKKTTIIMTIVLALMAFAPCFAQQRSTVIFGYDANGNRTMRSLQFKKTEENGKSVEDESDFLSEATDVFGAMEVGLFPNPTSGRFMVSVSQNESGTPLHIILSTSTGAVILDKTLSGTMEDIDISGQPAGIYILRLNTSNESHVWKVVKK